MHYKRSKLRHQGRQIKHVGLSFSKAEAKTCDQMIAQRCFVTSSHIMPQKQICAPTPISTW